MNTLILKVGLLSSLKFQSMSCDEDLIWAEILAEME